jgi:hypothetical protein
MEKGVRIPIKVVEEQQQAESLPAIVSPYTPRQADRLGTFKRMLHVIYEQKQHVRDNHPHVFGGTDATGRVVAPYFEMNSRFINIWTHKAQSRYEDEFSKDPALKEAALDIAKQVKEEFDGGEPMTAGQVRELFNRE